MSFLDDIKKGTTLRKATTKQKQTIIEDVICHDDKEYEELLKDASFENYYDAIKDFSFHSEMFVLEKPELQALVDQSVKYKETNTYDWRSDPILVRLEQKINEYIQKERDRVGDQNAGVFIRLSTISPKDAVVNRPDFQSHIDSALRDYIEPLENDMGLSFVSPMNRRIYALYIASTTAMKVMSADRALDMLIESGRTQQEISTTLRKNDQIYLVVREWATFDVAHEFRAFVNEKKLTAMTQYNPFLLFPHLVAQREDISQLVQEFFYEKFVHKLSMDRYILDVLLTLKRGVNITDKIPVKDKYDVKIIEINPFAEFAGTIMFTWENDRAQLMGKLPFQFRMVEELPFAPERVIEKCWQPFL